MNVQSIRNEDDYDKALAEIESLMDAARGTPAGDRLDMLATLIEAYETAHHPIEPPDPISAILFMMEQKQLDRHDLEPAIGSRAQVAEVLNRRRPLTLPMIRALNRLFDIPADILIQPYTDERASSDGLAETTTTTPLPATAVPARSATTATTVTEGGIIQLTEEQLVIGKRLVVKTPVEQQVTLHNQKVSIERRPVIDANFREKTIEVRETEEAIVSRTARVVEEVALRKKAVGRLETVRDTVRTEAVTVALQERLLRERAKREQTMGLADRMGKLVEAMRRDYDTRPVSRAEWNAANGDED